MADEKPLAVPAENLPESGEILDLKGEDLLEARIVQDPFSRKNPMTIIAHPPGYRLYWLNPRLRERWGMRGFNFVKHDDPVGRNLSKYILDPPTKMANQRDSYVRRGDCILGAIKEGIYLHRQMQREIDAGKRLEEAASSHNVQLREGVQTTGAGLEKTKPHPLGSRMDQEPLARPNKGHIVRRDNVLPDGY